MAERAYSGLVAELVMAAVLVIGPGCGTLKPSAGVDAADAIDVAVVPPDVGLEGAPTDVTEAGAGVVPSLCHFDGTTADALGVLAVAVDGAIVLVMSDGSTLLAYQFTSTPPADGILFSLRMQRLGTDVLARGTWWGDGNPADCMVQDGLLWCPETDRLIRISPDGEVTTPVTERVYTSSANIGNLMAADAGVPVPEQPVSPDPSAFNWIFPAGLTPMTRLVDSQGWFVAVLRDAARASVYRSSDAASDWASIGRTMGQVEQVMVRNVAGTYVIDAQGTNSVFVPSQVWQDAPAGEQPELLQDSHQLVRPAAGVADVIASDGESALALTSDGLCAANWEPTPSGRQLAVYDLTSNGARRVVVLEKLGIGSPSSLWLE